MQSGGWGYDLGAGGGGGSAAHDAHIIETKSVDMGAPMSTDNGVADIAIDMGTPGPWYVRELTVSQIGGDFSGDSLSTQLNFYLDAARNNTAPIQPFLSGAFPVTVQTSGMAHDAEAEDGTQLYARIVEGAFTGETVQYRLTVTASRPRVEGDG